MMQGLKIDIALNIKIIINSNDSNDSSGNSGELIRALNFLAKKRGKAAHSAVIAIVLEKKEMFFTPLTKLLRRKGDLAQGAVQVFGTLSYEKPKVQDAIRDCGAIEALIQLLFQEDQKDVVQRVIILEALSKIVHGNYKNQERILSSQRIPDSVQLLQIAEVRGPAADALRSMYESNNRNCGCWSNYFPHKVARSPAGSYLTRIVTGARYCINNILRNNRNS